MKRYLAEFFGTFMLVLVGTGAIVLNTVYDGAVTHLGISIAFGTIVALMIYSVGNISGAHINPAVTIGFWVSGRFKKTYVLPYLIAQFSGAIAASLLLKTIYPGLVLYGDTLPVAGIGETFALEFSLTFILMFIIMIVSTGSKTLGKYAGLIIGMVIFLEAYFAGPYTGASMNPARSFGPALISGQLEHVWIYLVSTTLGAVLAIPSCRTINSKECCPYPCSSC